MDKCNILKDVHHFILLELCCDQTERREDSSTRKMLILVDNTSVTESVMAIMREFGIESGSRRGVHSTLLPQPPTCI